MKVRRCAPEGNAKLVRCGGALRQRCPVRICQSCPLIYPQLRLTVSGITFNCGCRSQEAGPYSMRLDGATPNVNGVFILTIVQWSSDYGCEWRMSEDPNKYDPFQLIGTSYDQQDCAGGPRPIEYQVGWRVTLDSWGWPTGWRWTVSCGIVGDFVWSSSYLWQGPPGQPMECNKIYRTWTDSRPCGYPSGPPSNYTRMTTAGKVTVEPI